MSKFTPVPWAVGRWGETVNKADFLRFIEECWDKSGEAVAQFRPSVVFEDETGHIVAILGPGPKTEENSSMIAAAPDLYEALNAVWDKWPLPVLGDPEANAVFRQAEAALAKARGEA